MCFSCFTLCLYYNEYDTQLSDRYVYNIVECDRGWYGIGCNETRGHCRNESQCSNVNGTCLLGCDAGFKGDRCKICEYTCICYGKSIAAHQKLLQ